MTGVSSLGQALNQIERIKDQNKLLNTLSTQLSTGKKTQAFSGLGSDVLISKRSRADYASLETYNNNITHADTRIKLMLRAIEEFKAQAQNFSDALVGLSQESVHSDGDIIFYDDPATTDTIEITPVGVNSATPDVDFTSLQNLAKSIYPFMIDLLNMKDTDRYVMSGADTGTKPLNDAGTLDAAVSSLITNWKDETLPAGTNLTSDELISALQSRTSTEDPNAVTDSIIGYSPALSAGNVQRVFVRMDDTAELDYTALANDSAFRDVIVALSYIKNDNLGPIADVYAEPYTAGDPTLADGAPGATTDEMKQNFYQVYNALTTMVAKAIDKIDGVRFDLENARARLNEIKTSQKQEQATLLDTIAGVEDVDTTEVAVKIITLQTQLDASYRVTAMVQNLSLVNFLG